MLAGAGMAHAQLYVNGQQPVYIAANPVGMQANGPEVDAIDTTTADPRVTRPMVDPYLPKASGQQQWAASDVVGDKAPHPLFLDIARKQQPVPQQAAVPAPKQPDLKSMNETLYFNFDKAKLTPEAQRKVDELTASMQTWKLKNVEVKGYADRSGSAAYNEQLSRRRAERVASALKAQGLSPRVLDTEWYGESRPAVPTPDGQRLQANRRVVIQAVE
ncbi:OmpA family protein [Tistlia consotensis]|nr:OmpA family protein [Tistlia consotensis]